MRFWCLFVSKNMQTKLNCFLVLVVERHNEALWHLFGDKPENLMGLMALMLLPMDCCVLLCFYHQWIFIILLFVNFYYCCVSNQCDPFSLLSIQVLISRLDSLWPGKSGRISDILDIAITKNYHEIFLILYE